MFCFQLYDTDDEVAMEAADVLDEACEEEVGSDVLLIVCLAVNSGNRACCAGHRGSWSAFIAMAVQLK